MSQVVHIIDHKLVPVGHEQITGLSAAKKLNPGDATHVLIQAETQNVRWRDDGTDPAAGVGIQLQAAKDMWYSGDLLAITFIEETPSAKLNVAYYKGE